MWYLNFSLLLLLGAWTYRHIDNLKFNFKTSYIYSKHLYICFYIHIYIYAHTNTRTVHIHVCALSNQRWRDFNDIMSNSPENKIHKDNGFRGLNYFNNRKSNWCAFFLVDVDCYLWTSCMIMSSNYFIYIYVCIYTYMCVLGIKKYILLWPKWHFLAKIKLNI